MTRLYVNENFPLPTVEELRRLGHDVLTIQETGKAERSTPDEEVLAFAKADDRILLTLNRKHFGYTTSNPITRVLSSVPLIRISSR